MNPIIMDAVIRQNGGVPSSIPSPGGMNIPPPAGMAPPASPLSIAQQQNQPPPSLYKPMPIPKKQNMAPRAMPPLGDAAQQVIPPEDDSPIHRGMMAGIDAARESYALTDEQRRRAEGDAIMAFFGNMARSQNTSGLGAAAESFLPAMQQYGESEKSAYNLNKNAVDTLLKERREDRLERNSLRQQAGGLKVGNQIQLINNYTSKMADLNSRRNALISTMWNNLPEDKRTDANLALIKKRADQELSPYLHEIQKIKNYALSQGFDLDSMADVGMGMDAGYGYMPVEEQNNSVTSDGTDLSKLSVEELYEMYKGAK